MSNKEKSLSENVANKLKNKKSNTDKKIPPRNATPLEELLLRLEKLQKCFDEKIMEDEYKNGLFDKMHKELTDCRNEVYEKTANMMALDIIQLVDSIKRNANIFKEKEASPENYGKLVRTISGIYEDLEDILYRQNIEPYSVAGDEVDPKKQKIIQTISTDDKSLHNKIAQRTACGYEKPNKILRQERIKIYRYEKSEK